MNTTPIYFGSVKADDGVVIQYKYWKYNDSYLIAESTNTKEIIKFIVFGVGKDIPEMEASLLDRYEKCKLMYEMERTIDQLVNNKWNVI